MRLTRLKVFCILTSLTLFLSGCSTDVQRVQSVETHVVNESKPKLIIPEYPEILMKDVNFKVFKGSQIVGSEEVYYCLDYPNYKNLSEDTLIIQNYLIYLKKTIKAYQDYYEPEELEDN